MHHRSIAKSAFCFSVTGSELSLSFPAEEERKGKSCKITIQPDNLIPVQSLSPLPLSRKKLASF